MRTAESRRSALGALAGAGALVVLWWLVAAVTDLRIPTPPAVVRRLGESGWDFYALHFGRTLEEAALGFAYGTIAAVVLASLVLLLPVVEPVVMQVAVISYCIPLVALAPVLFIVIGNPEEGERSGTATALAALSVFFTTVVGTVLGLRSADRASLDVVHVFGGGRWQQLRRVQLVSAVPQVLAALQIAAPAAFLGAILGEYVGGTQQGVAVTLKIAQQNIDVAQAWAIGLGCAVVAGFFYAVLGGIARWATPWSKGAVS